VADVEFAGRLRELREAAGISQEELANRAGISVASIRGLEQDSSEPSWSTVLKLARALNVRTTEFEKPVKKRKGDGRTDAMEPE
jgi:transcriptional regulator with XRE-family HTH domain